MSHAWSVSFLEFDQTHGVAFPDSQCDFFLVCVGAKRTASWDGADWQYSERNAKPYTKPEAVAIMLAQPLAEYCRIVRQPKPEMGAVMWPTVNGWHMERTPALT